MANISASVLSQSNASNYANTPIFNALMQQVTANKAQCNNNHNCMLQQFAMMTTNPHGAQQFSSQCSGQPAFRPQATTQHNFVPPAIPMLAPAQQWGQPPRGGGRGSNHSYNGCRRRNPHGPAQQGAPIPFVGGSQIIPYILAGILANKLLRKGLAPHGYYECKNTPGL